MFNFLRPRSATAAAPAVDEVARAVAAGEMYLVDVRDLGELRQTGTAAGALHIPLSLIGLKADPKAPDALMAPGKPVAVFCAAGGRSAMAAQALGRMGYDPVWNLGGFADWQRAGGQVVRV